MHIDPDAYAQTAPIPQRPPPLTVDTPEQAAARSRWARLRARIYEVFPLRWPDCGAPMRTLAFLTDPEPVRAILRHLHLPATPPALSPARGPPQPDLGFDFEHTLDLDQTPAFDPSQPEPVPDLDFDQSLRMRSLTHLAPEPTVAHAPKMAFGFPIPFASIARCARVAMSTADGANSTEDNPKCNRRILARHERDREEIQRPRSSSMRRGSTFLQRK